MKILTKQQVAELFDCSELVNVEGYDFAAVVSDEVEDISELLGVDGVELMYAEKHLNEFHGRWRLCYYAEQPYDMSQIEFGADDIVELSEDGKSVTHTMSDDNGNTEFDRYELEYTDNRIRHAILVLIEDLEDEEEEE